MLPPWSDAETTVENAVFAAFAEPVLINNTPHPAIVARERVEVGDYEAVIYELRWCIYARKADVAQFARNDRIDIAGKTFRVDAPGTDDGVEITAWLREVSA